MAAKPKSMHQIKSILRLHLKGKSIRFISIHTGIARNTVREYIRRGKQL